jgi:TfoX/Sxy family transcriptional regulator of competence genes
MAFDEGLAERIRGITDELGLEEKKMFGGLCFLDRGNMVFGIVKDELMVRTGPDAYDDAVGQKHAREMDFTGRALKGMVYVASEGFEEDDDLEGWLKRGLAFAATLPAKEKKPKKAKKKAKKKK